MSAVLGPIWPNFELVRDVMNVLVTCKNEEDPIKNEGARVVTIFSPLYSYGSYRLPWTPEFRSDLVQSLMPPFPLPNDASDKIWLRLAHWLWRYSSLKMFTDGRTPDRLVYYKLTMSLRLRLAKNDLLQLKLQSGITLAILTLQPLFSYEKCNV